MAEFPTSIPTDRQSSASDYLNNMASGFGHVALHNFHINEIIALATKLGTGASVPGNGQVLRGNGVGTSEWGDVVLTTDVTGVLPVANGGTDANSEADARANLDVYSTAEVDAKIATPVITSFADAQHNHEDAAGGGQLGNGALIDGAVTPNKLIATAPASWVWQDWTPTLENLSGGTLNYARYCQVGTTVKARFFYTLAGAGVAGTVTFSLPVTPHTDYTDTSPGKNIVGRVVYLDGTSTGATGQIRILSTGIAGTVVNRASGTYVDYVTTTSTVPFTWGSGDSIYAELEYEMAV